MVVVKCLDSKYSRIGYEVQKGLMIDMPYGDGKAKITEYEDGTLVLSEAKGKYKVTFKNVQVNDFVDCDVRINVHFSSDDNHLLLENLTFNASETTIVSYFGHNTFKETVLSGRNYVAMAGQEINKSFVEDSHLDRVEVYNSSIKCSRVQVSLIDFSKIDNSDLINVTVSENSFVELSELSGDTVAAASVGGVSFGIGWTFKDWWNDEKRYFEDGYFVGTGKRVGQEDFDNGYVEVADKEAYVDELVNLIFNCKLPCAWDRDVYCLSETLKVRLVDGWETVPDDHRLEILGMFPFLKDVVES
jgi:hypothetical protein